MRPSERTRCSGFAHLATRPWHGCAGSRVIVEFVAQGTKRNAEYGRGAGAIAETMPQRFEDQIAFDLGNSAADQTDHVAHVAVPIAAVLPCTRSGGLFMPRLPRHDLSLSRFTRGKICPSHS
jgi:hypothetical protein